MDKLPVGQLPDLQQSNNDDEIMVITDSEHNQLKKEKISDLITDFTSTNENNALTKGTDGKMFVTDFGNASNITEGTLPVSVLPDIPKDKLPEIEITDLPESGVTADTYAYPASVTVNAQGQVTAIEEGEPGANNANQDLSNISEAGKEVIRETAGSDYHLTQNQITNCILSAPNGVATYSGSTITVKQGLKVLIPNGRNADGTLNNIEYTILNDISETIPSSYTVDCYIVHEPDNATYTTWESNRIFVQEEEPTNLAQLLQINAIAWYKPSTNQWQKLVKNSVQPYDWQSFKFIILGRFNFNQGAFTHFMPYQPVELLKRSDKEEITSWGIPNYNATTTLTLPPEGQIYTVPYDCYMFFCDTGTVGIGSIVLRLNNSSGAPVVYMGTDTPATYSVQSITFAKGTKLYVQKDKNIEFKTICPLIGAEI